MENYFLMVLLPHLDCLLSILGITGLIACGIGAIPAFLAYTDAWRDTDIANSIKLFKLIKKTLIGSILLLCLSIPIPSKTEIIQLKAVSILSDVKGLDQIPQKLVDKLSNLLELVDKEKE